MKKNSWENNWGTQFENFEGENFELLSKAMPDFAGFFVRFLRCDSRTIMKSFLKTSLANSQEICINTRHFLRICERFF